MERNILHRFSKKLIFVRSAFCILAACVFMLFSCGRLNVFNSSRDASAGAPVLEPTVIPPVPVTGSYLTTILMDELSKPIAQADVLADAGQFSARTDDKGVIDLPVRLAKDSVVELDVKINGQTFFINVRLPVDIADAVRSIDPAAYAKLPRVLGIRISDYRAPPPEIPFKRFPAVALSLPPQSAQSIVANTPVLVFAITSHKNADVVTGALIVSGKCDSGHLIKATGDVIQPIESVCSSSGSTGTFELSVPLPYPDGAKAVTLSQTDPGSGFYLSQLLIFTTANPPAAPTLTPANVSGLKPTLTGTCDSTASVHTATTSVGRVSSVTCTNGVLNVEMRLPIGTTAFNVSAVSTNSIGSAHSSLVGYTSTSTTCPTGYVGVPASNINGLGNPSASNGNARWWLDTSLDFCVMKYPAKNGAGVATSTAAGTPWVNIQRGVDEATVNSALKACKDAGTGYRLISNTQWQTVARNAESVAANWSGNSVGSGIMARGHTDNSPAGALENSPDNDPYFGTENSGAAWNTLGATPAPGTEQKRTQTLSNGEVVWDFAGNVWQWTSDNYGDLGLSPAIAPVWDEFSNTTNFPTASPAVNRLLFAPLGLYDSIQNIGKIYGGSSGAVLRGGFWFNGTSAGLFAGVLSGSVSHSEGIIGFRCVFLP